MEPRLSGRTAWISGAGAGIGRAIATRFHAEGAQVFACDRNGAALADLAADLGDRCTPRQLDVADGAALRHSLDDAARDGLHIVVNNAAVTAPAAAVQDHDDSQADAIHAVNMHAVYRTLKWAFPHLTQTRGCVLGISSMAGVVGQSRHALYAASKGWLNALTKATAVDWGPHGVRINALAPCGVMTPAMDAWLLEQENPAAMRQGLNLSHALGRPAEPREVAAAAAFLCSDDASFITGAILPVSGGSECGYHA